MASVRLKQSITFQFTGEVLEVGTYTVGKDITKEQFEAIKDKPTFCEVLDEPKKPAKPAKDAD